MKKFEAMFKFRNVTASTVRYEEVPEEGQAPKIKALYIQKWVCGEEFPQKLKVIVEEVN